MWVLTVASLTKRSPAISALLRPRASSRRVSRSRAVSEASLDGEGAVAGGLRANASMSIRVTEGASRASPAAAARTAAIRSCRGASFRRNPLAPAQRLVDIVVKVERGEHDHLGAWLRSAPGDQPCGLQPVHAGHADVHEHDVRLLRRGRGHGLETVRRLTNHADSVGGFEDDAKAGADQFLVVG